MEKSMKIKVKNYGLVRDAEIEFIPGLNVIRGESGSGKSTVLRGIEGSIFNQSGDSFVTQGEDNASLTLDYNNHIVTRERSKKETKYIVDGIELSKVGRTPVKEVLDSLGIKEIKTDSSDIRPNFLSQFSTPFLVDERPSKIFEFLTITSNVVNLKNVENEVESDLTSLKAQKKAAEEVLTTLKKVILNSSKIIEYKDNITNLVSNLNDYNSKKDKLNRLSDLLCKINDVTKKIELLKLKIDRLDLCLKKIYSLNIDYNNIHTVLLKINDIENFSKYYSNVEKSVIYLENKVSRFDGINLSINKEVIENHLEKIINLQKSISEFNEKQNLYLAIKDKGISLKDELLNINNNISEFKRNNIPIIVIDTNDSLERTLNIKRTDIIDILLSNNNV